MQTWLSNIEDERIGYDYPGGIESGLEIFNNDTYSGDFTFSRLFCSELVTYALQLLGAIPSTINPHYQTPGDVAKFSVVTRPILLSDTRTADKRK